MIRRAELCPGPTRPIGPRARAGQHRRFCARAGCGRGIMAEGRGARERAASGTPGDYRGDGGGTRRSSCERGFGASLTWHYQ